MYAETVAEIAKIRGQIDDVSYMMVEAEGEDYKQLSEKLDRLEMKLEQLLASDDMELLQEYGD